MKLLIEQRDEPLSCISESAGDGKKNMYLEGIYLQAGIRNANGRIYPPHIMEREVDKYRESHILKNKAFGETMHPQGPSINLDRVSHRCVSLIREGNNWIGKSIVADTPMGNIVKGLVECGGSLGVSSRALGSLREQNGVMMVQDDLSLRVAGDVVHDQSAPDAILRGIMESCDWIQDAVTGNWVMQEQIHETKKQLKKMSINEINEKKFMIFEHFLKSLNGGVSDYALNEGAPYYSLEASKARMAKEKTAREKKEAASASKKSDSAARAEHKANQSYRIARHIETEVGNHYPDSDGFEAIQHKLRKHEGIHPYDAIDHMNHAAKKHLGAKSFSDYVDQFHSDYAKDN